VTVNGGLSGHCVDLGGFALSDVLRPIGLIPAYPSVTIFIGPLAVSVDFEPRNSMSASTTM
jgi:hypothetical protein